MNVKAIMAIASLVAVTMGSFATGAAINHIARSTRQATNAPRDAASPADRPTSRDPAGATLSESTASRPDRGAGALASDRAPAAAASEALVDVTPRDVQAGDLNRQDGGLPQQDAGLGQAGDSWWSGGEGWAGEGEEGEGFGRLGRGERGERARGDGWFGEGGWGGEDDERWNGEHEQGKRERWERD